MRQNPYRFYQVLRVFLACPSDLVAERSRFPKILEQVNTLAAHPMGFHLQAVGWERVLPTHGRPQELINDELRIADLVVVMFWNRIGVPSGDDPSITGTVEEFNLALSMRGTKTSTENSNNVRPVLFVYFKKQTEPESESAGAVRKFRKTVEDSRSLLYRQYVDESEWDDLVREHLIAFLRGQHRIDLEHAAELLPPDRGVLTGQFAWQSIYPGSGITRIHADLDGDDLEEEVTFRFQQASFYLTFTGRGSEYEVDLSEGFRQSLDEAQIIHLAVKDVTNDGVPELLIAAYDGGASSMLGIFGMKGERFAKIEVLEYGQWNIRVHERGHIVMPYGSVGLSWDFKWNGKQFVRKEVLDVLRPVRRI